MDARVRTGVVGGGLGERLGFCMIIKLNPGLGARSRTRTRTGLSMPGRSGRSGGCRGGWGGAGRFWRRGRQQRDRGRHRDV